MTNLLPPNSTQLERNIAAVNARLGDVPTPLRDLMNPDTCPAHLLPWLAAELAVSPWNDQWTEMQKRAVIASSYQVHRQRGTLASLKAALIPLGLKVDVVEWWQENPPAAPYTFRLDVDLADQGLNGSEIEFLDSQVQNVKPVRSHYKTRFVLSTLLKQSYGCATLSGETTEVLPYSVTSINASPVQNFYALGVQDWMATTIYPKGI
jgi:phage tail P2-like protein